MKASPPPSTLKVWLLVAASLIDDAAVLVLIFLGLWFFHVKITWVIILVVVLVVIAFFLIMHKAVVPAFRRRQVTGAEGMLGASGEVTRALKPTGTVKIKDEYWQARSVEGAIKQGEEVEVVAIDGLTLTVKRKGNEH